MNFNGEAQITELHFPLRGFYKTEEKKDGRETWLANGKSNRNLFFSSENIILKINSRSEYGIFLEQ